MKFFINEFRSASSKRQAGYAEQYAGLGAANLSPCASSSVPRYRLTVRSRWAGLEWAAYASFRLSALLFAEALELSVGGAA
jgi:hypothetical protein